jgi:flagellar biogenesis protein FliO
MKFVNFFILLTQTEHELPSMGWLIFKTLMILILLGGLLFVLLKYGGDLFKIPMFQKRDSGLLKLEGVLPLEPKRTLFLISVKDEKFIIGSSENGISLISQLKPGTGENSVNPEKSDKLEENEND